MKETDQVPGPEARNYGALEIAYFHFQDRHMTKWMCFIVVSTGLISGCNILQKTAKTEFVSDFYYQKDRKARKKVYVDFTQERVEIFHTVKDELDTAVKSQLYLPELKLNFPKTITFYKPSFDVDFLTIPLKLRPAQRDVPTQLNSNINGAVHLGYRTDFYRMEYKLNPHRIGVRKINHFGYSVGLFTGFGNTFMSPTNTDSILQQEYDGVVWSKGLSGILAVNNFTVGLSAGFDNLLGKNSNIWIYKNKPWLGLAFGLNIN